MDRTQPLRIFKFRGRTIVSGYAAGLTEAELLACVRSWAYHLDDGGVLHLAYTGMAPSVELRKRRWKRRADLLLWRYRNADATRRTFADVQGRLDADGIEYEMTLTRKTQRPRALEIRLDPYDPHTARVAVNLAERALGDAPTRPASYDLACSGKIREDAPDAPMSVEYPLKVRRQRKGYDAGFRLGAVVGKILTGRDRGS